MARAVRVQVKGIHCESCENTIRSALSRLSGVVDVRASHETQQVDLIVQGDGVETAVKDRLRDLGFDPVA